MAIAAYLAILGELDTGYQELELLIEIERSHLERWMRWSGIQKFVLGMCGNLLASSVSSLLCLTEATPKDVEEEAMELLNQDEALDHNKGYPEGKGKSEKILLALMINVNVLWTADLWWAISVVVFGQCGS